ncbi:hypothetical protein HOG48_00655 [Candidatus Peregrinibacteria bacterium]|nr:hypothetical protein [Candidatus Peregrinibacteria bacterium]
MAENLRVTKYRDGATIPNIVPTEDWGLNETGAYCIYKNKLSGFPTYGALYNWHALMDSRKITPEGWHVPTLADWTELKNFLSLHHPNSIVKPLQSTSGWKDPGNGTDNYGFSALPGGHRSYSSGYYLGFGTSAHFWSSTKSSHNGAFCCRLHYLNSDILLGLGSHMRNGFAIRCLKD